MILEEYLAIITSQHAGRPRFVATVEAILRPAQGIDGLLQEMRAAFDLDAALGAQLDATGLWIGRTRYVRTPLDGVYFSWGDEGVGWGQGLWQGLYDPDSGIVRLPDDIFRALLKAKVAANAWDGTIPGAYEVWATAFSETGSTIIIEDNQDMSMVVGIAGVPFSPVFEQLLIQGYVPLKPVGVRIAWYAITPEGGPLFAWNSESSALDGWNTASWPQKITPTL